jgi:hypothetical protein
MDAIIVPCTDEKVWDVQPAAGAVAAKDAYTKSAFVTWRNYAEQSGCPWFILSTRYGLIPPDTKIERHNVPVSRAVNDPKFLEVLRNQGRDLNIGSFDHVVLMDWRRFEPLVRAESYRLHERTS